MKCSDCGRIYEYKRSACHTKEKCNSCLVNNRRFLLKKKCLEYLGGKCSKCGYAKCSGALHFHRKNPDEKEFMISESHCLKWERIKIELDKCVLLCANCHCEEHYN